MSGNWLGSSGGYCIFEDTLQVAFIDREGKPFQSVSRIEGTSAINQVHIELDINTEIYPVYLNEHYNISLIPSLNLDGTDKIEGSFNIHEDYSNTILGKAEYVMHGKIFRLNEDK
jgi:DNA-directed RNA polymerase I, II, and III subunit RPABC3